MKHNNYTIFDEFMCVIETTKFLGITANTLRKWEKQKKIKVYGSLINKYPLYNREDLSELLKKGKGK